PDTIEDVLPGRQALDQRLGGEVGFRQRIDVDGVADGLEAVGRRHLDQHACGSIRASPNDAGIDRYVARLDAVRDHWPLGGAAERRRSEAVQGGGCGRRRKTSQEPAPREWRAGAHADCHVASAVESRRTMRAVSDSDSKVMRRSDESERWPATIVPSVGMQGIGTGLRTTTVDVACVQRSQREDDQLTKMICGCSRLSIESNPRLRRHALSTERSLPFLPHHFLQGPERLPCCRRSNPYPAGLSVLPWIVRASL